MISVPFAFKSRRESEALGMGALPLLVLPHPVGQLPRDEMRAVTDESFPEVEFILTAPTEAVARVYTNRTKREPIPGLTAKSEV